MEVPATLPDLARWAREQPVLREEILDPPWGDGIEQLSLTRAAADQLRRLCETLGVATLGQALEHPKVTATLTSLMGVSRAASLIRGLGRDLAEIAEEEAEYGDHAHEESPLNLPGGHGGATTSRGSIPSVPADIEGARRWAAKHGVADRLGDPARMLAGSVYAAHPAVEEIVNRAGTVEGLLSLTVTPWWKPTARRGGPAAWEQELRDQAVRTLQATAVEYLHRTASVRAALLAVRKENAGHTPPAEGPLAALWQRLAEARAALAARVPERPLGTYLPGPAKVDREPLRIVYLENVDPRWGNDHVRVEIRVEEDPLRIRCSCTPAEGGSCVHALAALDTALDLLRVPSPAREGLARTLATPIWQRFLNAFGEELGRGGPETDEQHRLAWRIGGVGRDVTIEPLLQKRTRSGFSSGQRLHLDALPGLRSAYTDPRDQRAVSALLAGFEDTGHGPRGPLSRARLTRTLEALVGHPLVFMEGRPSSPARISRERLTVALEPREGAVSVAFHLGRQRVEAATLATVADPEGRVVVADREEGTVALCTLDDRARALVRAFARHPASFPPETHDDLLRAFGSLQESVDLVLPEALAGEPIEGDARPVARLAPRDGGEVDVEIRVRPAPGGPLFPPGEGAPTVLHAVDGRRVAARRDFVKEIAAASALAETLPEAGDDAARWTYLLDEPSALDLLARLRDLGEAAVVEWREPDRRLVLAGVARAGELRVRVTDRRDWFGVEGGVEVDGRNVPLAALLDAVRSGRRYVRVGPGQFAAIEEDLRRRVQQASDVLHAGRKGLEVALPGVALLEDLVDDPKRLEAAARFRDLVRRLGEARHLDPALPKGLRAELRPYQVEGYKWVMRLAAWGAGACLADDMGLGKTVQALGVLLARARQGPALVIAPTSVGQNWIDEASRFAPGLRARHYRGPARAAILAEARPGDLLVTSYGLVVRDAEALGEVRFASLVIDEAQAIKNALTRRARAVAGLDADLRIALTGTPVENHLGDLWSLMRVLTPGLLGSWDHFRDRFATPIERGRDPERRAALGRVLRPFLLRRTKAEVAPELPPRTEIQRLVHPSAAERALYDAARTAALEALAAGSGDARFALLAALTRLRRLACHPRLVDDASTVPSSKLSALLEIVEELREEGHRALVFSQFTTHLALVREALDRRRIRYQYLDGATPAEERARRVAAFQAGGAELFLISLKAGGSGLNLTGADYVIHLDPWWNPAVEDQATDRAHRIGQTRAVTVIRLVTRGTIEEAVLSLHGEKRALAASVFDEEGSPARLSTEELAALLRAGIDEAASDDEDAGSDEEPRSAPGSTRPRT